MEIPSMGTSQAGTGGHRCSCKRDFLGGRGASLSKLLRRSRRKIDAQHITDVNHAYTPGTLQ